MVATGNLLDLEEMAKAPLSTVSANTANVDEAPRPPALSNSSVVWVSVRGDPVSLSLLPGGGPRAVQGLAPVTYRHLGGPPPAQQHPGSGWAVNNVPFEPRATSPTGVAPSTAVSSQCPAAWPKHPPAGRAKGSLILRVGRVRS